MKNLKCYQVCKDVLKFEFFYKILILFCFSPLLRKILKEYLKKKSDGIAFNQDIVFDFISISGVIIFLLLFITMILIIYYELYVVIQIIVIRKKDSAYPLKNIILKSFQNLRSIHKPTILLTGIYIVLLLPLVHIGYLNSYVPRWDIPPFIFGELKLTMIGYFLICLIYFLYYSLYLCMLFVPLYIILKQCHIIKAIQESVCLIKKIDIKTKIKLLSLIACWMIIEYLIMNILPYPILHNRDFNIYFLKYVINFESFRYSVIQYILLYLINVGGMIFFIQYLIKVMLEYEKDIITIDMLPINTDYMNELLLNFRQSLQQMTENIKKRLTHLGIYRNHKRISQLIIITLIIGLVSIYLQQDSLIHRPWVIGHRGSGYYVENSYEAVKDANDTGIDYAEIDIQLSQDGIPIVFHDNNLSRLSNRNESVEDLTAVQLENVRLTNHHHTSHIMTLENMIKKMKEEKMKIGLLIELKPTSSNRLEMVEKVIQVIERQHFSSQAIFMSLDYESVKDLTQKRPEWWVGYCIYGSVGDIDSSLLQRDIDFLAIEQNRASTSFIQKAVSHVIPIYIWTVDSSKKMKQYLDMGVSGIITNYPDLGKNVLDKYESTHQRYYYYDGKGYPHRAW